MAFVTVYQGAGGRIDLEYTYTQSIPNNTTSLTVKAYVVKTNSSYYSYNNSVNFRLTVAGSNTNHNWSFNFSNMTLNTRYLITSTTRTLSHNSNGTHANVSMSVYSATNTSGLGTISGSTSISIPTIPRASSLNSFSFANSLQIGTPVTINLSISRNSSSFTHDIQLRDGTTVLQSWNGQGVPTSLTVSSSTVNTMLNRMSTVTSKTFTLRVQTKSGSTNIGSPVTRTATASIHSNVTPTATGLGVSIYGNGRDKQINKFVQNISRVTSSFTGSARGGATVSSRRIVIRRVSGGANSQTISGGSGTTGVVTLSGTYEAIATVTDSRKRSATQRITFTVHAYSPPTVNSFTAVRDSSTPTTVNIGRYGSWSALGGDNSITIVIKRGSTTIQNVTGTSGNIHGTLVDTGISVTSSYTYTVTLTDSFGNSTSASASVSTQAVLLDIHKDLGIGIGKMHEPGGAILQLDTPYGVAEKREILSFGSGYSIFQDNYSTTESNNRLWIETPDKGEVGIGPRAGANSLERVRIRALDTVIEGNIKAKEEVYVGEWGNSLEALRIYGNDVGTRSRASLAFYTDTKLGHIGFRSTSNTHMVIANLHGGGVYIEPRIILPNPNGSAANQIMDFSQGYGLYCDADGYGTAKSRLNISAPDQGELFIGPRAGADSLSRMLVRATRSEFLGNIYMNGSLVTASERKLKKNIEPLQEKAVDIIKDLKIYKFNYLPEDSKSLEHIGLMYDEAPTILKVDGEGEDDTGGIDLTKMIFLNTLAMQELNDEIASLKDIIGKGE